MVLGECKCCAVYKEQVRHLQGLLDQTLGLIAPKTSEPVEKEDVPEDAETVKYGD